MAAKKWTDSERNVVRDRYAVEPTRDIAKDLGRSESSVYQFARGMGLKKSPEYLRDHVYNIDPETGKEHRIKPGNKPWNAGKKGWNAGGRSHETQFPPGNKPNTWKPVGHERTNKDGVLERKISDTGVKSKDWRPVHVLEWEKINGPLPSGHIVVFKDHNHRNFSPDNLEAITRAENMRRNSHYNRYPIEISRLIQLRASLNRKINERARDEKSS